MASNAREQNDFLYPTISREHPLHESSNPRGRQSTVYDAVAGRISAAGFIPKQVVISASRDTASSSTAAVSPEAVLFRRKNAPTRYEEADIYFANERELRTELPSSDLLKALHCYTSDFYSRATDDGGTGDYRSLDETALIGLGILMEEAARDVLGQSGDLVFTEGEEVQESSHTKVRPASTASKSDRARPSRKRRRLYENHDGDE